MTLPKSKIIPSQVQIGSQLITVETSDEMMFPTETTFEAGNYFPTRNLIHLYENLPASVVEENFIHEIVEAIDSTADLQLDHTQISILGALMYQALSSGKVNFAQAASTPVKKESK